MSKPSVWERTKKSVTLGVAKAKDGMSSSKKKKENEDPAYVVQYDHLHELQDQCSMLIKVLTGLGAQFYNTARSAAEVSQAFSEVIPIDSEPYHTHTLRSKDGNDHMKIYAEYLKNHYIPQNEINLIKLCQEQIAQLKVIKNKRKEHRVLLKQEESHLATAREKNKDVQIHEERTRNQREQYERYHNDFLNGVSRLYENRMNYFGKAYQVYQFYMLELIELQKVHLVSTLGDFPFERVRQEVPSLTQEPPKDISTSQNESSKFKKKKDKDKNQYPSLSKNDSFNNSSTLNSYNQSSSTINMTESASSHNSLTLSSSPYELYEQKEDNSSDLSDDLYPMSPPTQNYVNSNADAQKNDANELDFD